MSQGDNIGNMRLGNFLTKSDGSTFKRTLHSLQAIYEYLVTIATSIAGINAVATSGATQASVNVIDGIVDDILVDTGTTLPATLTDIHGHANTIDNHITADYGATEKAKIDLIGTSVALESAGNLAAVLEDTGTTLPATLTDIHDHVVAISGATLPTADSTENLIPSDIPGNKTDAAQTTVGTTRSIMAYVKGCLNQLASLITKVDTIDDYLDTEVAAVKAKTDLIKTFSCSVATGTIAVTGTHVIPAGRVITLLNTVIAGGTGGHLQVTNAAAAWLDLEALTTATTITRTLACDGTNVRIWNENDTYTMDYIYYYWTIA